ncbi:JmjC domain-containing protein [Chitinophaga sancti]|uniref:Cupin domain-containing protein n=1 Tax=Chitinophaga sancti TaxID=1004 RepID=A0A1K1LR34_9BACT|nr:cupin domain-containing protein [Chitinophaga sancti]WQD64909.1 cupin domain-containing protein [Chitinophaga sancti]WQG89467.1 cupin domain-containing protein [Chitinophaga sancti]SFW13377.1 Cupin superfamily protein [Chitinophaga sancti]
MLFDFQQLIAPFNEQEFIRNYFEKSPLVIRRGDPHYYTNLLSLAGVDNIIKSGIGGGLQLTMSHAAKKMLPADYMTGWNTDYVYGQTGIDPQKVFKHLQEDRASIIIHNAIQYHQPLQDLVTSVDEVFNCSSGVNLFITPSHAQCFQVHYDEHDLFIIQVSGSKHWKIFESGVYLPLEPQNKRSVDFSGLELLYDITLEQGDLLYMPRGFVHEVTTTDLLSCHITLGMQNTSLIKRFADYVTQAAMQDDPLFRKAYIHGSKRSELAQLKARLKEMLSSAVYPKILHHQGMPKEKKNLLSIPSLSEIH